MRLTFMLAAAAIASPIAPVVVADPVFIDPAATGDRGRCVANRQIDHRADRPMASSSRLGDMPPATHIGAVYRMLDGCPAPIVIAREVGNPTPGAKADDPALPGRIMPSVKP